MEKTCLLLLKMERKLKFGTLNGVELDSQKPSKFNFPWMIGGNDMTKVK